MERWRASRPQLKRDPLGGRLTALEAAFMRMVIVVLLLVFWLFFAYRAFARGDTAMAGLFLLIGLALTIYRLRRA